MKMKLFAVAALACCSGGAWAQSALTIYGVVDAAYVRESGGAAGTINKISSGAASESRIGFHGTEDLGNGVTALFLLEAGFRIDTGEQETSGSLFNRQAFVGLKSNFGTLTIGRQHTPWHLALKEVGDPFATGTAAGARNLFPDFGANRRTSNTIMYAAPERMGFTAKLAYSPGEQADDNSAGEQVGASIGYSRGPLNVRLAYNHKNSDIAPTPGVPGVNRSIGRNLLLAANYDFNVVKAYFAYSKDEGFDSAPLGNIDNPYGGPVPIASTDGNEMLLGVSAPLGNGTLLASIMRKDDETVFNQDAKGWGIGYIYPLSKRTEFYTAYGSIDNDNGAGFTVGNASEPGSGDRGFNLGVRHTF